MSAHPSTLVPPRPRQDSGPQLLVEAATKRYQDVIALAGVDLEIGRGEIVALLGANGAGKTTLMSIVCGLRRPDSGKVWIRGIDVLKQPRQARAHLGLAPQETGIYPTLTARENLRFFGELAGLRRRALSGRIAAVADALELSDLLPRPARTLSGGQARRLHTAMTLMSRPPLLLLDEPTVGVDVQTRARLLEAVRNLADDGTAVCYSTHYLPEVEQLNASVAIIDHGRIVAHGTLQELVDAHAQSAVELHFDGPPPTLADQANIQVSDTTLLVATSEPPAIAAAQLLAQLGTAAQRLRSVKLVQPSLESVFLEVTQRTPTPVDGEPGAQGATQL